MRVTAGVCVTKRKAKPVSLHQNKPRLVRHLDFTSDVHELVVTVQQQCSVSTLLNTFNGIKGGPGFVIVLVVSEVAGCR